MMNLHTDKDAFMEIINATSEDLQIARDII